MSGQLQVLQNREVGEAACAGRHVGDVALGPAVWGPAADVEVPDADGAGRSWQQADDAHERCGLAGAVAAQQRDQLAVGDVEVEVEDDVALPVADVESADLEHQKKDSPLVTGVVGRAGFAGPNELSRSPAGRGPPGGGPEGEACLPLPVIVTGVVGRAGFAGPNELSRSPAGRGPPGGGPEGEACLPLPIVTGVAGRAGFAGPNELSRSPAGRGPPGGGPEGEACLPLPIVTGVVGRAGFAGPIELSRSPARRGPPGGGPEGEACLPLPTVTGVVGRAGFAGPNELSRSPAGRGPPGGGPEGEACLPLPVIIRPPPRLRAPRGTPSERPGWRAPHRAHPASVPGPGTSRLRFAQSRRLPPCRARRRAGSAVSPGRHGGQAPWPSPSRKGTCLRSARRAGPASTRVPEISRSRSRVDRRVTAGRRAASRTGRARRPPAAA